MRICLGLLAAVALASFGAPAMAGSAISLVTPGTESAEPHRTLGFEFSTLNAQSITALGAYDSGKDGLQGPAMVGVWDTFGNLLASATIPSGTGASLENYFRYVSITPLALVVGQHYVVGSWDADDLEAGWNIGPGSGSAALNLNLNFFGDRFSNLGGGSPDFAYPDAGTGSFGARLGANFKISPTIRGGAIPEPATWAMMLVGCGLTGGALRRRRMSVAV